MKRLLALGSWLSALSSLRFLVATDLLRSFQGSRFGQELPAKSQELIDPNKFPLQEPREIYFTYHRLFPSIVLYQAVSRQRLDSLPSGVNPCALHLSFLH